MYILNIFKSVRNLSYAIFNFLSKVPWQPLPQEKFNTPPKIKIFQHHQADTLSCVDIYINSQIQIHM